jgi:hypothetical protein
LSEPLIFRPPQLDEQLDCKSALVDAVERVWDGERDLERIYDELQPGELLDNENCTGLAQIVGQL